MNMDGIRMNILNEEINAIKHTIEHLKKGAILEPDSHKKEKMKRDIKELNKILMSKLEQCEDYKG